MGTAVIEGQDFGRCFFTKGDGSTGALDGGMFHVLQARPAEPSCVDSAAEAVSVSAELSERVDRFVSAEQRQLIGSIAGTPFAELEAALMRLGSCALKQVRCAAPRPRDDSQRPAPRPAPRPVPALPSGPRHARSQVLSPARFVPHELNAAGLHMLRSVMAEEMKHARAVALGYDSHPDYETWRRDGLLLKNL